VSDWDARTYDRVAAPQESWALELLERLPLGGDETVLDAGCGSGRVTRLLIDRLPRGRVVAVDSSPAMVDAAQEVLRAQDRSIVSDLTELELDERVDAVFSNAVFHWIEDHDLLFRRLGAVLDPGGVLVAQCGGAGNVARFHEAADAVAAEEPFAQHFTSWTGPWNFASPDETTARLEAAGFTNVECWLEDRSVNPPEPKEYLRTVCLRPYLDRLPDGLSDSFLDRMTERFVERWTGSKLNVQATLDYVRLNMNAQRA
jgi:trans-aconitate 2-methyltransferase